MLERLTDLPDGVDGFRARGKLTKRDYRESFAPFLETARRDGRKLRFMFHAGPDFEGFTAGALLEDMRLALRHAGDFERLAIVTDTGWLRSVARTVGTVWPAPIHTYSHEQRGAAEDWLGASAETLALSHELLEDRGVLVIEPHARLRAEDFEALSKTVDPWIETHGELGGIVIRSHDFPFWADFGSFLRHVRFVRDHKDRVRRVALAVEGRFGEIAPKLAERFTNADLKRFDYDEIGAAIAWAGEKPAKEAPTAEPSDATLH